MTPLEAIRILTAAKHEVEWNYPLEIYVALELAIDALKKEVDDGR